MKKSIFTLFLALAASVGTMFAVTIDDIEYYLNEGELTAAVSYSSYSGEVFIPSSVNYNNQTYSVTSIGSSAFRNCSGLTSVTIGNSVTSINYEAFQYCTGLTSITIPNSVTWIGFAAFYGCSGLTSVTIGNSVTSIGSEAFSGCYSLKSVIWNAKNCVNNGDFGNQVESFTFGEEVESIPGNCCYGMNKLTTITIPNSVTSIGSSAFYECTGLTSVTIGNSVTSIGNYAFYNCTGLTSVTIPNSVTSIGDEAFYNCSNLNSITLPNSVTSIGYRAFQYCTSLTTVSLPKNLTSIYDAAFANCSGLTSITIPNSVTSIGYAAFYGCSGLTSVTIPNSVTSFGWYAFEDCSSLIAIYVPCGEMGRFKQLLSSYSYIIKYVPLPYSLSITQPENGTISYPVNSCDEMKLTAQPNYGYHFTQWSDGITDNPRTIELTQDTTFTAEFAKNEYTITTESANSEWGTTAGDGSALYLDEIEISATANYGYHFARWNDGNSSNPRKIVVTKDESYTATFAKNIYSITKNTNDAQGYISGPSQAEYLDNVTLTAQPNYGYHFRQWSDGITDNPRTIELTQDTAFTAEFAIDRSGNCGDNLALTWEYDAEIKALTIKGEGDLCSNYTFGVEAPDEMEKLIISEGVTAIGNGAFANQRTLKHISIASSVKTVYEQAFYNCTGLEQIYSYRNKPAVAYSNTFDGIDKFECTLHVLDGSVDMYKAATGWRDFYYIETIDAETITEEVEEVVVTPTETTANIVWPQVENSDSYTLIIWADEAQTEKICTLIFDAEGHLTGIDFSKKASRSVYTQEAQVAGFSFTVTGLDAGTEYFFNIIAKDEHGDELKTETGSFTTKSSTPTAIDEISNDKMRNCENAKILHNGHLFILRDGKIYNAQGARVE